MRTTLEAQPGVDHVAVDFGAGEAMFTAGPEFDLQAAIAALAEESYGAKQKG